MFVPREALAGILSRAEVNGPFPEVRRSGPRPLDQVKYVPCPLCHNSMNRLNFGKVSGVIVDVCRAHGTWFDGGELTRAVAFAAAGGLTKTRAREQQESLRAATAAHVEIVGPRRRDYREERIDEWRYFLKELFFW